MVNNQEDIYGDGKSQSVTSKRYALPEQNKLFCSLANVMKPMLRLSLLVILMLLTAGVNKVWGQDSFTLTTTTDVDNGTETLYWIESKGATGFFAIPHTDNTRLSTSNMPNERMLWYFMDANTEDDTENGKQYYYVVNKSTGKYMKLAGNLGSANSIQIATFSASDTEENKDKFRFVIVSNSGAWVFHPKSATNNSYWVNKDKSNVGYNTNETTGWFKASNYNNTIDDNSRWFFRARTDVTWAHPFTNSTNSEKHYYNIKNATTKGAAYYISTDDDSNPYATISNVDDSKRIWYFVEAASDNAIPNLKYYYIVNAVTGKYLKFTGNANGNLQANSLRLYGHDGTETGETENRFQFMVLNAKGDTYNAYSIMPKLEISYYYNRYTSLSPGNTSNNDYSSITLSNDMKIGTYRDRGQNNNYAHWLFVETDFVIEAPTITNNGDGTISLSTTTAGATIYYTTNGDNPDNTSTEYSSPFSLGDATVIKAIAYLGEFYSDVTTYIVPQQYEAPTISFNATTSQVTISPTENVYYTMTDDGTEPSDPTTTTGTQYTTPFSLTEGKKYIIKAVATYTIGNTICYTEVSRLVVDLRQNTSTDLNGYYYLQNNDDASFYMYPNGSNVATKKKNDLSAVWQLVRDDGTGAYRIIHYNDSKYLVADPNALTNTLSLSDSQNENSLFVIEQVADGIYTIQPRNSSNYLNPTQGNDKNIGLSTADDSKSKWVLGKIPAKPTFSRSDIIVTITPPFGDVYYKLINRDASEPETDPTVDPGTKGKSVTLEYGPRYRIKAISAYCYDASSNPKKYWESDVETKDYTVNLVKPTISYSGTTVTISSSQNGVSFKYTIDDTDPKTSGTANTGATFTLTEGQVYKVRAIAFNTVSGRTYWSSTEDVQYVNTKVQTEISSLSAIDDENGSYILTSSFSPTGSPQNSIGTSSKPFKGVIDGRLTTIENLSAPLFDCVENAVIKNVIIKSAGIDESGDVGAIAREAKGTTRIYNCGILDGSISGSANVGGIVGGLDDEARVINCFSNANITGGNLVGGIVGNNKVATTAANPRTMVMNCMFYGDITGGTSKAPIYNGSIITNVGQNAGVGNFNYFRAEADYVQDRDIDVYNCALAAETRYLNRFEFFRHLLNSNRALAAWWATGSADNKDEMMKWVQETSDRSITTPNTPSPYPILKPAYDSEGKIIKYPSPVNIDAAHVEDIDAKNEHYNEGRKLGTLRVYIKGVGSGAVYSAPSGAQILKEDGTPTTSEKQRYFDLNITDKDPERYNFNYYKVQLPYYNDCGTNNYKGNRVVTGWKIVEVSDGGSGSFTTVSDDAPPADATAENGVITSTPYNFADRKCSNKDLYGVSGRVFSQGAYYDVPEGVTWITIEPYWAQAVYVSDPYLDKVYNVDMNAAYDVTISGQRYTDGQSGFNGDDTQKVYTTIANAVKNVPSTGNVYDNAIVLVGNTHNIGISSNDTKQYTIMSVDLDKDNEPDYSYILRFNGRNQVHPVRIDFLNVIGLGMAQKSTGGTGTYNFGIMQPRGWFEVTNTGLFRVTQLEYDHDPDKRTLSPVILQAGVIEQWVTFLIQNKPAKKVKYYHVGGNVWFKEFHVGAHQDRTEEVSPHPPISVTGGDYDNFYLTGYYNTPKNNYDDNAECYINGGRFGRVCGTGMQGIGDKTNHTNGNIIWQIDNADIDEFYAGGLNAAHKAEGNITTVISNSRVDMFCGGPKFGDMNPDKKVFTNATNCIFRTFFGAGYGGNSYNRRYPLNQDNVSSSFDWDGWVRSEYTNKYDKDYEGVEARIDYQFLPNSGNTSNVARLFVDYVSFSLATTHDVTTNLTGCTITTKELGRLNHNYCLGNFYGGGSLGKVNGPVKSTLTDCTVEGYVYGGGYSATTPTVSVMVEKDGKWFQTPPFFDENLGAYLEAELPTTEKYSWEHANTVNSTETAINTDNKKLYTTEDLDHLGTVMGDVTLTISGKKTVIGRSVYGGGEESAVEGSTTVSITDGKIGTKGLEEGVFRDINGNVYGAGKGDKDDYTLGHVKGNTTVTINGNPTIYHNVYGGGAYGSVGTISSYSASGMPTFTDTETKGKCTVIINGGTIGTTGRNNGMVFGSSRGDEGNPNEEGSIINRIAWTYDTEVVIGSTTDTETPLHIFGSVYGGGENGHNYHNSSVTVNRGTIGVEGDIVDEKDPDNPDDDEVKDTDGASYSHRGNVYGGGCGTDVYYTSDTDGKVTVDADDDGVYTWYNPMAGVVGGNATVNINGGTIVHCVYGAGSMGSVGIFTFNKTTKKMECLEGTGLCTINISGGRIGTFGMKMPDDWGYVFGAGRGETKDPTKYLNIEQVQYVNNTEVTISGKALVIGGVYGGAENGHVLNNTHVTIAGGQIGVGEDMDRAYTDEEWVAENPSVLKECAHWPFQSPYDPYDVYVIEDGKPKPAKDGHTFYGNVFGGGSGYFPYSRRNTDELNALLETNSGYADGLWLPSAGMVGGNTVVDIKGGHILTSVYGGNECTDVNGSCTVNMSGGTVGVPRTKEQILAHPVTCNVFGAGKGDQRINFNQWTNVASAQVNITGGRIYGSVFGGGEDGHVIGDAKVNISQAEGKTTVIGSVGTSGGDGNVYGGGRGFSESALTAGAVCGNVDINISGGTMLGSIFGGGRLAPVGTHIVLASSQYYGKLIDDGKKQVFGDKDLYKQINNEDENMRDPDDEDAEGVTHGHITINISGGTIGSNQSSEYSLGDVFGGCKGTLNTPEPFGLSRNTKVTISETDGQTMPTRIYGNVFGGGEAGDVEEGVEVTINGGTIGGDVYGGGAKAGTNIKWKKDVSDEDKVKYYTNVNLHGGVINGRVFGGGLGQKAKAAVGEVGDANYQPAQEAIAAIVGGDVKVELNKNTGSDNCVVKKQIFGCNNLNGTPRGQVTVHIYKTQGWGDNDLGEKKSDPEAEKKGTVYELDAVYGGGNEAAYLPADSYPYDEATGTYTYSSLDENAEAYKTNVIIEGCDQTSIRYVYGGGNSAPSPATSVTVHSCYEIGTVFGGGNGADRVDDGTAEGMPNLGANVGYTTYSYVDASKNFHEFYLENEWPDQESIWSDTKERRIANYKYGTGKAETRLYGGTIHNAFGGSNTLGNVCSVAFSALDELDPTCELKVGQIYGAGNKAFMDAKIEVDLGCISGLDELYGGAVEADVNDNIVLDVTSGHYKQVFGGNNKGGKISGTITVNVKEMGCRPVEIEELYGGGNEADYEAPLDEHGNRVESPIVNIISATSVGTVYGGGRLANVTGNPVVTINMEEGVLNSDDDDSTNDETRPVGKVGNVFGGGYKGWVHGDTRVEVGTDPTKKAEITGSVYGGGDNADVIGKTEVIIGNAE